MNSSPTVPSPFPGLGWGALGILSVVMAFAFFIRATHHFLLWRYSEHYVPAEFEVTNFNESAGAKGQGRMISGVIHPGGEAAVTSDSHFGVRQFVAEQDRASRRV